MPFIFAKTDRWSENSVAKSILQFMQQMNFSPPMRKKECKHAMSIDWNIISCVVVHFFIDVCPLAQRKPNTREGESDLFNDECFVIKLTFHITNAISVFSQSSFIICLS